jgi:hypothetical protein
MAGRDAPSQLPHRHWFRTAGILVWGRLDGRSLGAYSSAFLAFEAVGLSAGFHPAEAIRHLYVLIVVTVGWVILRSDSVAAAGTMLQVMAGAGELRHLTAARYLTLQVWVALILAIVGAGPLIPWLSRWRVSVDALTAALVMMVTSVSLFAWRGGTTLVRIFWPSRPNDRPKM